MDEGPLPRTNDWLAGSYQQNGQDWYDSRASRAGPGLLLFGKHSDTSWSNPAIVCTQSDQSKLLLNLCLIDVSYILALALMSISHSP